MEQTAFALERSAMRVDEAARDLHAYAPGTAVMVRHNDRNSPPFRAKVLHVGECLIGRVYTVLHEEADCTYRLAYDRIVRLAPESRPKRVRNRKMGTDGKNKVGSAGGRLVDRIGGRP